MKRKHDAAFSDDCFKRIPKDCENRIMMFLSTVDLCRTLAAASSRMRDLAYEGKNWRKIKIIGVQNQRTLSILDLHGRKMDTLKFYGMRISRGMSDMFSKCKRLMSLDMTGIWKSPAVNDRFVNAIRHLPLRRLLFGQHEVQDQGFNLLCDSLSHTLEELDFNSRTVSSKSLCNVHFLVNLTSLCVRSCIKLDDRVVQGICSLPRLETLQLSFLPGLHCSSLQHVYGTDYGIGQRLQTLVLNGMHVDKERLSALSVMTNLQTVSLCHPSLNSNDLYFFRPPRLRSLTMFCANQLFTFDFLQNLPNLRMLCLYRCSFSVRSLQKWAKRMPRLMIRIFARRPLRDAGVLVEDDCIDYDSHENMKKMYVVRRPYPVFYV